MMIMKGSREGRDLLRSMTDEDVESFSENMKRRQECLEFDSIRLGEHVPPA